MYTTNEQGKIFVSLIAGDYGYLIEKAGYQDKTGTFTMGITDQTIQVSLTSILLYTHPIIKKYDDAGYTGGIVYFDPSYTGENGSSNGTKLRPYTNFNTAYQGGIPSNTVFLFKRGTTHPKIGRLNIHPHTIYSSMIYSNNYIGAYGVGNQPIIQGFHIKDTSNGLTVRDINIKGKCQWAYTGLIYFYESATNTYNVTFAYCNIEGEEDTSGFTYWNPPDYGSSPFRYPGSLLRGKCHNFVMYNCKVSNSWSTAVRMESSDNVSFVRNHFSKVGWVNHYNAVTQTEKDNNPSWTGANCLSLPYKNVPLYIAGNYFDKSFSEWKVGVSLGYMGMGWYDDSRGHVMEYNTILPPLSGSGGGGVAWNMPPESYFRYNLIDSSLYDTYNRLETTLVNYEGISDALRWHFQQSSPVYVYNNAFIRPGGDYWHPATAGTDADAQVNNVLSATRSGVQAYIDEHSVGSDIVPSSIGSSNSNIWDNYIPPVDPL